MALVSNLYVGYAASDFKKPLFFMTDSLLIVHLDSTIAANTAASEMLYGGLWVVVGFITFLTLGVTLWHSIFSK